MSHNLFEDGEMKDRSVYAIKASDALIVKLSKIFIKQTILKGDQAQLICAYQKGAIDFKGTVLEEICIACDRHTKCTRKCKIYKHIAEL